MITNKTVFVLGAGASKPFGFPLGRKLINEIIDDLVPDSPLWKSLSEYSPQISIAPIDKDDILEFRNALTQNVNVSIDEILKLNEIFWPIGKMGIASVLLKHENPDIMESIGENWYGLLLGELNNGISEIEDWAKNKLTVITYNYDRSLEFLFHRSLKNSNQNITDDKCWDILNKGIKIIHLHGKLGGLEWRSGVPYHNKDATRLDILKASQQIKIVHEDIGLSKPFEKAHVALKEAERIYIFGFGFDENNLKRLLPDNLRPIFRSSKVRGTAYGLVTMKKRRAKAAGIEYIDDQNTFPNKTILQYFSDPNFILD